MVIYQLRLALGCRPRCWSPHNHMGAKDSTPPTGTEGEGTEHETYVSTDGTERISTLILRALMEMTDTELEDQLPLYEVADPDALDAIFEDRQGGRVAFEYTNYRILVVKDGERTVVDVAELD